MSTGAIIAIAVGATVIFGAALVAFVLWIMRMNKRQEAGALARLAEESARRGWKFEERNDSYCAVYNEADTYIQQSLVSQVVNPADPLAGRLRAIEAHEIISGTHRGRPFLAARFKVTSPGPGSSLSRAIWVQAPGRGPALQVSPSVGVANRVDAMVGQGDLQVGDPDFDNRWAVDTGDQRFARAVLSPQVTNFLKTDTRQFRGFTLLGANLDFFDQVSDYRDPKELIPALDLRCDLLDLIPRSVWA
jgi:hypothetical protein